MAATTPHGLGSGEQFTAARYVLVLGLLLTSLVFASTIRFDFVYDDLWQIVHNPYVQSWSHAPRYFTQQVWAQLYADQPGDYYRPVFLLWLLLNHTLFGLHPAGWHLSALLLHLLTTLLLYFLARKLNQDAMLAAIAAVLFGLHPIHIEPVAWVSGATETLAALPMIGALLCYLKQRETRQHRLLWQSASLVLFLIAVLAKETAIMLPVIIAGCEWLLSAEQAESRSSVVRRMLRGAVPFLILAAVYLSIRFHVLKGFGRVSDKSLAATLLTWPSLLWFYLKQLVWPVQTSAFYDTAWVLSPSVSQFFVPLLIVMVVLAALLFWAWRSRMAAFALIWLAATMVPPLWGIRYFEHGELAHDRYLYIPSVGFVLLLALAIRKLPAAGPRLYGVGTTQAAPALALVCLFAATTATQSVHWANNLLLYSRGVRVAPRNTLAWDHLGTEWLARGRADAAIEMYHQALALDPGDWNTNFALGMTYSAQGNLVEADRFLSRACELRPTYANQFYYLGVVRTRMARWSEAEQAFRRALEIWPRATGYHQALGAVLEKQDKLLEARDQYRAELLNDPQSPQAHQQLAAVQGRLDREVKAHVRPTQ